MRSIYSIRIVLGFVLIATFSTYLPAVPNSSKEESKYLQPASSSFKPAFMDTKADLILTGPTEAYTQYGNYPRFGDVNGDGYEDLLVAGAWHYNEKQGRLYLYYGGKNMDDKPDKIFTGEEIGHGFGSEAALADVNGDGYADVVTGAAEYNNQQGRVYIFYGGPDMDEKADVVIDGEAGTHGYFGHIITAGDVNNDGYKDVIASAVFYNNNKGRVYLFYGGNPMDATADVIFDGRDEKDHYFGRDINNPKMIGDVNGDGYDDLLISSRYWNRWKGASGQGRACLYYGGPGTSMDAIPDKVFTGENREDDFGCSGCIFDVDNDGFDDVIIGARGYNNPQGGVYLYWGGVDMDTVPDKIFKGESGVSGWFGCGLDAGDVNNDDYGDIVVAAPFYSGNPWSGRAYLFYGGTKESINTNCDKVFTLPTDKKNGSQHVALGDIDNDKCLELAIGGPEYNNSQGRVWLYDNKPPGSSDESPISLQEAATAGDIDEIKTLISKGVDIDAREWGSLRTALHNAAEQGHKEIVELLLVRGAKTEIRDALNATPLHSAARAGHKEIVELLQKHGAKESQKNEQSFEMAILSKNVEKVKELISQGADVNVRDSRGNTPLSQAIMLRTLSRIDRLSLIKMLISAGADVNAKNKMTGGTSLHAAAFRGDRDLVELLVINGADLNAKNGEDLTPLEVAQRRGNAEIVEILRQVEKEQTLVHDVAITKVSATPSCVQGETVSIRVTVENRGNCEESTTIRVIGVSDGAEIGNRIINLLAGGKADLTFDSPVSGLQQFGNYVYHGDVNADGYDDLLVTASRYNECQGRAYLYHGGIGMDANPDMIFTGENVGDYFSEGGWLGDINGDSVPDVILGALGHNGNQGRVYIYYGGPDMDGNADVTIDGELGVVGDFGRTCTAGDVNGDGYEDLFVGAIRYNDDYTGRIYLYYGGDPMDKACDLILTGENPDDTFGWMIDASGDVDHDGLCDLVTSTRWWPRSKLKIGRAYLYYGGDPMDGICDVIFTGENSLDEFGSGVEVGDIDNDGHADILIGARRYNDSMGRVYLYWGKAKTSMNDRADLIFEGEDKKTAFGGDDIEVGDINNDGYREIAVAAYGYPDYVGNGRVYLYHGDTQANMNIDCDRSITFSGRINFVQFITIGNFDGDSYGDLVVGGWGYPDKTCQGRVWLCYGGPSKCKGITFSWDTTKASIGRHTLKVEIPPVPGEQNTEDNVKTVTIEVKEPQR